MTGGKFSWVEKRFIPSSLINDDGGETGANGKKADEETRRPPKVDPIVITKVALVSSLISFCVLRGIAIDAQ